MNIFTLGSVQCCLITAVLFILPLQKKSHWKVKLLLGGMSCLLSGYAIEMVWRCIMHLREYVPVEWKQGVLALGGLTKEILVIAVFTLLFRCVCNITWKEAFLGNIIAYITQDIAYTCYIIINPMYAHRGSSSFVLSELSVGERMLEVIILIIVCTLAYFLFAKRIHHEGRYVIYQRGLNVINVSSLLIVGTATAFNVLAKSDYNLSRNFMYQIILGYDLLVNLAILTTILLVKKNIQLRKNEEIIKHIKFAQEIQYDEFRKNSEMFRRLIHDLKYQMNVLKNHDKDYREQMGFYDVLQMDTGNELLNLFFAEKLIYCQQKEIKWTIVADGKEVEFIDAVDLYTLLGNLLDNAIEHLETISDIEKRVFMVKIKPKGNMVVMHFENYCVNPPSFADGIPVTTKQDRENHGYGIVSIQSIVEKYNGYFKMSLKNNKFITDIMIPKK